jgi:polysaccharide export outer membrane protein
MSATIETCDNTSAAVGCKLRTVARLRPAMVAACLTLVGAGCGASVAHYPYHEEPDPRGSEYVIGVSDELAISVWKNRELDARLAVRPDGNVTLPLIGDIRAAGRTPSELRAAIAERLGAFVVDREAPVTVAVLAVNSYFVTVAGSVATPGRIAAKTYLTVADAIALAGGPSRFAQPSDTILIRRGLDGRLKRIPIDYERIIAGRNLEQNLILYRGDRIYVP